MLPNLLSAMTTFQDYNIVFDAIVILFTLIYLIPFYIVLITSFKADNQIATQNPFVWFPTGEQLGFQGYKDIFETYTIFETGESMIVVGLKNTIIMLT